MATSLNSLLAGSFSGASGYSGYSGAGLSGYSGYSGQQGFSGISGYSGYSGYSGSGISGFSGFSGFSGAAAGGAQTLITFQNRQLGASTNTAPGQNSLWLTPFYVPSPVSASTILTMMSITGTLSSNTTGTFGVTDKIALYQVTGTNSTQFDTIWTAAFNATYQLSGTTNFRMTLSNPGGTTSTSAGSSATWASLALGFRMNTIGFGSIIQPGLYMMGYINSTSTGGYSAFVNSYRPVFDNPAPVGKGFLGSSSATSIGYNDSGIYATGAGPTAATTTGFPASVAWSNIVQVTDIVPYYKFGGH